MSDFLSAMARDSARRCQVARTLVGEHELGRMAGRAAPPVAPRFSGFDLIAEIKTASPSRGTLRAVSAGACPSEILARAESYARAGAAVISVLTEPSRFAGSLDHLRAVAGAVKVPVMRKDFLVDVYQVVEARAAGASGVLLIIRILDDGALAAMLAAASSLGLFVLLEAFDRADLTRAARILEGAAPAGSAAPILLGLNCRNLADLSIDPHRFADLRAAIPPGRLIVAESGLDSPADVARTASLGYDVALVGSSLMLADDPHALVRDMLAAGRAARAGAHGAVP